MTGVTIFRKTSDQAGSFIYIGKEVWGDELSVLFLMSSLNNHFYRCYCWREVFFCLFFNAPFTSGSDLFSQKTGYEQKHLQ